MDSIRSAEAAWVAAQAEYSAIEKKQTKVAGSGLVLSGLSITAMVLSIVVSVFLKADEAVILALILGFCVFAMVGAFVFVGAMGFFSKPLAEAQVRANSLRNTLMATQKKFVESHGITLPRGAFEALFIPVLTPEENAILGTADVLMDESRELSTVLLQYSAVDGYVLYTTEGRRLRPLTAPVLA